ncbi:hypothetical protein JCM30760_26420 [Thiomicrorhabdus hydrogeniphila]
MSVYSLVNKLKEADEDHEFYPTTIEIIEAMHRDLTVQFDGGYSFLDCGAGNGKVITELRSLGEKHKPTFGQAVEPAKCYAIEKSSILLESLPKDVFIVGTDYWQSQLIDKNIDVLFTNPPYKQAREWVYKAIREANAKHLYFVIPQRIKSDPSIQEAIDARQGNAHVVGTFDFIDSEDRKARAKVDLIRIDLTYSGYSSNSKVDPFDLWFDESFKKPQPEKGVASEGDSQEETESSKNELIQAIGLVEALEQLYQQELQSLLSNYEKIQSLDAFIFEELNIDLKSVKESLKLKISSLKSQYWRELFSNLDKVTSRLTHNSRETIMGKLFSNMHVDFSVSNAHAIMGWVIRNANTYYDIQLKEVFTKLMEQANVITFKSNKRVFSDNEWRYHRKPENLTHVKLDLRIVLECAGGLDIYGSYDAVNGLQKRAATAFNDIVTIANNLGFTSTDKASDFDWSEKGAKNFIFQSLKTGKQEVLMSVKAFKNGNCHIKFNQAFIFALNVEMARLCHWVQNAAEAANELEIPIEIAEQHFNTNFYLSGSVTNELLLAS